MYDTHNYLVTSKQIMGPWSAPVPLNDLDSILSVSRHRRPQIHGQHGNGSSNSTEICGQNHFAVLPPNSGWSDRQRISIRDKIFLEGPHIFKRNGWYYLFTADTGTGELHWSDHFAFPSVWGPYEMYQSPVMERTGDNEAFSILTTRHHEDYPLQKAGHADLVETQNGEWYAVHLCGRPSQPQRSGPQALSWLPPLSPGAKQRFRRCAGPPLDDWLVLDNGTTLPDTKVPAPELPPSLSGNTGE